MNANQSNELELRAIFAKESTPRNITGDDAESLLSRVASKYRGVLEVSTFNMKNVKTNEIGIRFNHIEGISASLPESSYLNSLVKSMGYRCVMTYNKEISELEATEGALQ